MKKGINLNHKNPNNKFLPNKKIHSPNINRHNSAINQNSSSLINKRNKLQNSSSLINKMTKSQSSFFKNSTSNLLNTPQDINNNSNQNEKLKIALKNPAVKKITIKVSIVVALIALMILFMIFLISSLDDDSNGKLAISGYYPIKCQEVTVNFVDSKNNYSIIDTKTYPLEEYVAGVVFAEVGNLTSLEVYKAYAIAARTFLVGNENNCSIESSTRKQVFKELTGSSNDELIKQAVNETKGIVLLSNGSIYPVQYDAFACIDKDDNYYTISQANQKIPIDWVDRHISKNEYTKDWFICNGRENLVNHHGNGMSHYGSYYLATEEKYTYDEIFDFYLSKDDVTLSKGGISSIEGINVTNTSGTTPLTTSLNDFLASNGSSTKELNNYIYNSVSKVGKGTRAGVVAAATSLINYLNDNYGVTIPYRWGGKYKHYGIDGNFGSQTEPYCPGTGSCYYYKGFDCSGFVSWAIKNGGYKFDYRNTRGLEDKFGYNSCNIGEENCIGQPGDLINAAGNHVMMIVVTDVASKKYMIAESLGGNVGLIIREWNMHSGIGSSTKVLLMDDYYNNPNNVDLNY